LNTGQGFLRNSQAQASAFNYNAHPSKSSAISITANQDADYQHYIVQEYSAQVNSGSYSLGITISANLESALADQHGNLIRMEYSYHGVAKGMGCFSGFHSLDFGPIPQAEEWSLGYANTNGYLHGNLTGIGAQFDD
jgi:hypothetical protein